MFDKNYKNAMDSITPDNDTRDKILDRIILKEEVKKHKNPATPWRVAFACVACVALLLGVIFIPKDAFKIQKNGQQTLTVSKSYDEIYNIIKPKISLGKRIKKKVIAKRSEAFNEYIVEEEVVVQGGAGADTDGNNDTAIPNASQSQDDVGKDFSTTTEQVDGVSEADIVKTDGEYIYYLIGNELSIFKADGEKSELVHKSVLSSEYNGTYGDMFLKDDRLVLLQTNYYTDNTNFVSIIIYDITNPGEPQKIATTRQEGWYNSSRMVGDYVYLISNCNINVTDAKKDDPSTFVPVVEENGVCEPVPADSIYRYNQESYENCYTVIGAFNYKDGAMSDTANLLGGTDNIYCSQGNIILANTEFSNSDNLSKDVESFSQSTTTVSRLTIKEGQIEYKTTGSVDGTLDNQFYIDEHDGYFRFVTTVTAIKRTKKTFENAIGIIDGVQYIEETDGTSAQLTVLDSELKKVGEIKDLAKGERVYSVRFMGDVAYFVTFRQTDPLFSADLSDPANPKILGELKIPGFSEYMYPYGDGLLLGFGMDADEKTGRTTNLKLSMFDISDPANVTEQDKTLISGYRYSTALSNHKAMLVSVSKNLIGFAAHDYGDNIKYMIYEHADGKFNCKAQIELLYTSNYEMYQYYDAVRGLFISDYFYIVSDKGLQVFDIATFSPLHQVII